MRRAHRGASVAPRPRAPPRDRARAPAPAPAPTASAARRRPREGPRRHPARTPNSRRPPRRVPPPRRPRHPPGPVPVRVGDRPRRHLRLGRRPGSLRRGEPRPRSSRRTTMPPAPKHHQPRRTRRRPLGPLLPPKAPSSSSSSLALPTKRMPSTARTSRGAWAHVGPRAVQVPPVPPLRRDRPRASPRALARQGGPRCRPSSPSGVRRRRPPDALRRRRPRDAQRDQGQVRREGRLGQRRAHGPRGRGLRRPGGPRRRLGAGTKSDDLTIIEPPKRKTRGSAPTTSSRDHRRDRTLGFSGSRDLKAFARMRGFEHAFRVARGSTTPPWRRCATPSRVGPTRRVGPTTTSGRRRGPAPEAEEAESFSFIGIGGRRRGV